MVRTFNLFSFRPVFGHYHIENQFLMHAINHHEALKPFLLSIFTLSKLNIRILWSLSKPFKCVTNSTFTSCVEVFKAEEMCVNKVLWDLSEVFKSSFLCTKKEFSALL